MRDILLKRREKLTKEYRNDPNIFTYARLQEIGLLLKKFPEHDTRASKADTSSAKRRDTPELQQHNPSVSPDGRYI